MNVNLSTFVILFLNFSVCYGYNQQVELLAKANEALEKTINFVVNSPKDFNVDGYFGCTIAIAHIKEALKLPIPSEIKLVFLRQVDLLQETVSAAKERLEIVIDWYIVLNQFFTDVSTWRREIKFELGNLNVSAVKLPEDVRTIDEYYHKISVQEFDSVFSDGCFFDLVSSNMIRSGDCPALTACWNRQVLEPKISPGYNVSHRVLYLVVADLLDCPWDPELTFKKAKEFCSYMYWEADMIQNGWEYDEHSLFDLFMEQTVFCGMLGFEEFLKFEWIAKVLSVDVPTGCYLPEPEKKRSKRSYNIITDDGCSDHTTGLTLAGLALYNRYLVEKLFM